MKVLDYPNGGKPAFVYTFEMKKYENTGSSDETQGNMKPQGSQDMEDTETKGEDMGLLDLIFHIITLGFFLLPFET